MSRSELVIEINKIAEETGLHRKWKELSAELNKRGIKSAKGLEWPDSGSLLYSFMRYQKTKSDPSEKRCQLISDFTAADAIYNSIIRLIENIPDDDPKRFNTLTGIISWCSKTLEDNYGENI